MKTSLAAPRTKLLVHLKPSTCAAWASNGEEGWTIGPSLKHYRCIKVYLPKTRGKQDVNTVTFFSTVIPYPNVGLDDF